MSFKANLFLGDQSDLVSTHSVTVTAGFLAHIIESAFSNLEDLNISTSRSVLRSRKRVPQIMYGFGGDGSRPTSLLARASSVSPGHLWLCSKPVLCYTVLHPGPTRVRRVWPAPAPGSRSPRF